MESVAGILTFIAIALGALTGLWLARYLPEAHLSSESRTAVSVSMAVVGSLAALVMGLLISSASSSFNAKTDALHRTREPLFPSPREEADVAADR